MIVYTFLIDDEGNFITDDNGNKIIVGFKNESMIFPGLSAIPENADAFALQEFSPSESDSTIYSLQVDTSSMINPGAGFFTVMGSNISGNAGDMIPVTNEIGQSGQMPLASGWVAKYFAYKYIGIQYTANGNVGAGTLSVHYEQKAQRSNLI